MNSKSNMADIFHTERIFAKVVAFSVLLKLLLLPTYRSTDFEVHRNWLAITHSLPISQWYYEDTSQWTLDYPPFFAWFEFVLSQFAVWVDPGMVKIQNLEYSSKATIVFQRLTVVATDIFLVYACYQFYLYFTGPKAVSQISDSFIKSLIERQKRGLLVLILVIFNFGLIIVDHIHFQYNGFLFGILLLSITRMLENEFLWSAFWFSVLLNFKHIYLYIAPAYFVYLLRRYCFIQHSDNGSKKHWIGVNLWDVLPVQLIKLGLLVISVFAISFGPFIAMGQLHQVLLRLFPFKRGLCHAYWAPNFWALYNVVDKLLTVLASKFGVVSADGLRTASLTSGLIGQLDHTILPSISPLVTVILTLLSMLPCLVNLWLKPYNSKGFLKAVILCAFGSFIFGWHVHEKAVLLITIPLSLLSFESLHYARIFLLISTAGNMSLFPLLFQPNETPIKVILMLMYTLFSFWALEKAFCSSVTSQKQSVILVPWYEKVYLSGMILLQIYNTLIHSSLGLSEKLPFLPLLLTSFYCAIGVLWSWLLFYHRVLNEEDHQKISSE